METQQIQVQTTKSVQTETPAETVQLSGESEGEASQASTVALEPPPVETKIEESSLVPAVVAVVVALVGLVAVLKKKFSK
jgi:hypothetical protein